MDKTKINGIEVFTKGTIENQAIVFVHGNSLSALSFKKQFELIDDIPIVAISLQGHGNSKKLQDYESSYCLPGYIETIKNTISILGISNYILAGHSLGGHIAIEASEELNSAKGLFIFGTPPIGLPPQMEKMFHAHPLMGLLFSGEIRNEDAISLAQSFVYDTSMIINEIAEQILQSDPNSRINLGASIGKGLFKNEIEIIKELKIPIAIIHGKHDTFVNSEYIEQQEFGNLWSNQIVMLENSGHCPHIEQPVEFNNVLYQYYNSVFP